MTDEGWYWHQDAIVRRYFGPQPDDLSADEFADLVLKFEHLSLMGLAGLGGSFG